MKALEYFVPCLIVVGVWFCLTPLAETQNQHLSPCSIEVLENKQKRTVSKSFLDEAPKEIVPREISFSQTSKTASNVSGKWIVTAVEDKEQSKALLYLRQNRNILTGSIKEDNSDNPSRQLNGKINGNNLFFVVVQEFTEDEIDSNEFDPRLQGAKSLIGKFTGVIKGNTLVGNCQIKTDTHKTLGSYSFIANKEE